MKLHKTQEQHQCATTISNYSTTEQEIRTGIRHLLAHRSNLKSESKTHHPGRCASTCRRSATIRCDSAAGSSVKQQRNRRTPPALQPSTRLRCRVPHINKASTAHLVAGCQTILVQRASHAHDNNNISRLIPGFNRCKRVHNRSDMHG